MAQIKLGNGAWMPAPPRVAAGLTITSTTALTATGHKVASMGRVWNKDGTTKTLVGVGLLTSTVVKAGGSALTISQQGVDAATGPPYQPDGTAAQSWAVANGDFATTTWLATGDNAGQSVTFGQLLAIVVEYDGAGRLGSDSVPFRGITPIESGPYDATGMSFYNGTSWAVLTIIPNVVLKFSDGTYGTLEGAIPFSATTVLAYNTGSAADEAGLEFTVSCACKADGAWAYFQHASGSDAELVLYGGTTALETVAIDANAIPTTAGARFAFAPFPPRSLATGTTYRLALKPTTTNNVSLSYLDLNVAAHRQALPGFGEAGSWTSRVDGGSFTPLTTRWPLMGLRISHVDDGASVGGMIGGGNLSGGLQ